MQSWDYEKAVVLLDVIEVVYDDSEIMEKKANQHNRS